MTKEYGILTISGKCSDMFSANYSDDDGCVEYDGYVPRNLGIGGGDYIELNIDMETGLILNWKPKTKQQVLDEFQGGY